MTSSRNTTFKFILLGQSFVLQKPHAYLWIRECSLYMGIPNVAFLRCFSVPLFHHVERMLSVGVLKVWLSLRTTSPGSRTSWSTSWRRSRRSRSGSWATCSRRAWRGPRWCQVYQWRRQIQVRIYLDTGGYRSDIPGCRRIQDRIYVDIGRYRSGYKLPIHGEYRSGNTGNNSLVHWTRKRRPLTLNLMSTLNDNRPTF